MLRKKNSQTKKERKVTPKLYRNSLLKNHPGFSIITFQKNYSILVSIGNNMAHGKQALQKFMLK